MKLFSKELESKNFIEGLAYRCMSREFAGGNMSFLQMKISYETNFESFSEQ